MERCAEFLSIMHELLGNVAVIVIFVAIMIWGLIGAKNLILALLSRLLPPVVTYEGVDFLGADMEFQKILRRVQTPRPLTRMSYTPTIDEPFDEDSVFAPGGLHW